MNLLVTGAAGKVGQTYIRRALSDPALSGTRIRAFCHNRVLEAGDRIEVVRGDMASREDVTRAVRGATHVLHLATCKETPEDVMDVAVKGLFWLLEACRESPDLRQFILIGGDAAVGHFDYAHPVPVTETQNRTAYKGCYALSKVLEEVMLEQYWVQYGLNGCILRAPWIMEKDDFRFAHSFGDDVFGEPLWGRLVGPDRAAAYVRSGAVPLALDAAGRPLLRNFLHVEDLTDAIVAALDNPRARHQLFNIGMDEPVDYGRLAAHLHRTRGLPAVEIPLPAHSTWFDNAKAKLLLGWRPRYDLARLADSAWDYARAPDDPRKVWYPG